MSSKTDIDFYYSISSRYSYLASTQIDALESETGCTVSWFPVDGRELRALAASMIPMRNSSPFFRAIWGSRR